MDKQKVAICYGITGQDGSYLAKLLLKKGHFVVGVKRRTSIINTSRVDCLYHNPNFKLEYGDMNDVSSMYRLLIKYKPDEIYNLAAQSHVKVSFELQENTVDTVAMGTLRLLNAVREIVPNSKFYQASSSEMFGDNPNMPLNEESTFMPASPYACAKLFAHNIIRNYRKSFNFFGCSGILFNHESEKRGETFVTRKISIGTAMIKMGLQDKLFLGNLDAKRDWGHAKDFVEAMWLMLQQDESDDFVIATGENHSVREFCELAFDYAGLGDYKKYVEIDPRLFRPHEVPCLLGDYSKAKEKLGWSPKIKFDNLVKMMYDYDISMVRKKYGK
jgi:GDPmannose 4,6-dehydratase